MPRPNRPRAVFAEDHLARRIAAERESRGWTNDGLAKRMTDAGCPMTGSAIFKIEKGEPRRRIVVDELVAFAKVFGISVDELLMPPELAGAKRLTELVARWDESRGAVSRAEADRDQTWEALQSYVSEHPELSAQLEACMETWAEWYFDEQHRDEAVEYWMYKITDSTEWRDRFMARIEAEARSDRG